MIELRALFRHSFKSMFVTLVAIMLYATSMATVRAVSVLSAEETKTSSVILYETLPHGDQVTLTQRLQLSRKPYEVDPRGHRRQLLPTERILPASSRTPATPRAPPYGPRDPPFAS